MGEGGVTKIHSFKIREKVNESSVFDIAVISQVYECNVAIYRNTMSIQNICEPLLFDITMISQLCHSVVL